MWPKELLDLLHYRRWYVPRKRSGPLAWADSPCGRFALRPATRNGAWLSSHYRERAGWLWRCYPGWREAAEAVGLL